MKKKKMIESKKDIIALIYLLCTIMNFINFVICGFYKELYLNGLLALLLSITSYTLLIKFLKNN